MSWFRVCGKNCRRRKGRIQRNHRFRGRGFQRGQSPFWHTTLLAKSSVLYLLDILPLNAVYIHYYWTIFSHTGILSSRDLQNHFHDSIILIYLSKSLDNGLQFCNFSVVHLFKIPISPNFSSQPVFLRIRHQDQVSK